MTSVTVETYTAGALTTTAQQQVDGPAPWYAHTATSLQELLDRDGTLTLEPGVYRLDAPLLVADRQSIMSPVRSVRAVEVADPSNGGVILQPTGDFPAVKNADQIDGNVGITLSGVCFDGSLMPVGATSALVDFGRTWRTVADRCYFKGGPTVDRYGINIHDSCEQVDVTRSFFEGCGGRTLNSNEIHFERCEITGQRGVVIEGGSSVDIYVDRCHIYYCTYQGVRVLDTDEVHIADCLIEGNKGYGVHFERGVLGGIVARNKIRDNGTVGIYLDSNVTDKPTTGNRVCDNILRTTDGRQSTGIRVASYAGAQTNGNVIGPNVHIGTQTNVEEDADLTNTYVG